MKGCASCDSKSRRHRQDPPAIVACSSNASISPRSATAWAGRPRVATPTSPLTAAWPADRARRYATVEDFLAVGYAKGQETTCGTEGLGGGWPLPRLAGACFALLDDGKVVLCEERSDADLARPHEVWALRGSVRRWLVGRPKDGAGCYRYLGWLNEADVVLDEEYLAERKTEEITLV